MIMSNFLRRKTVIEGSTPGWSQQLQNWISNTTSRAASRIRGADATARVLLLAPVLVLASWLTGSVLGAGAFHPNPQGASSGPPRPSQSSPIALSGDDVFLVNVNPEVNTVTIFLSGGPNRIGEVTVGKDPVSVAIHPSRPIAYVANSEDGTLSVVDLPGRRVVRTINVGAEPSAVAFSPNGSRLYVANSASNNLMVINPNNDSTIATVDLSPFGTAPRAIGVTNDGDDDDTDETIFVALFFGAASRQDRGRRKPGRPARGPRGSDLGSDQHGSGAEPDPPGAADRYRVQLERPPVTRAQSSPRCGVDQPADLPEPDRRLPESAGRRRHPPHAPESLRRQHGRLAERAAPVQLQQPGTGVGFRHRDPTEISAPQTGADVRRRRR